MKRIWLFVWMIFGFVVGGYLVLAGAFTGLRAIIGIIALAVAHPSSATGWEYLAGEAIGCAILVLLGWELAFRAAPKALGKIRSLKERAAA